MAKLLYNKEHATKCSLCDKRKRVCTKNVTNTNNVVNC